MKQSWSVGGGGAAQCVKLLQFFGPSNRCTFALGYTTQLWCILCFLLTKLYRLARWHCYSNLTYTCVYEGSYVQLLDHCQWHCHFSPSIHEVIAKCLNFLRYSHFVWGGHSLALPYHNYHNFSTWLCQQITIILRIHFNKLYTMQC